MVLTAASSEYEVGTFDGKAFTAEEGRRSCADSEGEGFMRRRLSATSPKTGGDQIGWLRGAIARDGFNQCIHCTELKLLTRRRHPSRASAGQRAYAPSWQKVFGRSGGGQTGDANRWRRRVGIAGGARGI